MTVIVERIHPHTHPVFRGRSRWAAAALVTVGAALQVVEFVLEPAAQDTAKARLAWWLEHPDRLEWSQAAGLLAIPFLIGGFAVMVALTRRHSRRLAGGRRRRTDHGDDRAGRRSTGSSSRPAWSPRPATPTPRWRSSTAPGTASPAIVLFVMFLGGALVGTLTIYIAMWRSPYVPRAGGRARRRLRRARPRRRAWASPATWPPWHRVWCWPGPSSPATCGPLAPGASRAAH